MNIDIKDNRVVSPLSKIDYGGCFELSSLIKNCRGEFTRQYFMKIKGADHNKPENIMFVNIQDGETHSLPCSSLVYPIRAKVEVKL